MGRLTGFRGRDVRRAAERLGWRLDHWAGDHMVFKKQGSHLNLSIPDHRDVSPGTLRQIIRTMAIEVDQFLELVKR